MGKGWGYGKNYDLLNYSKLSKVFENAKMKVYKANIIYIGYLAVTIIHNKSNNDKRVILKYENKHSKYYDFKNISLKNIIREIENKLLDDYYLRVS